MSKVSKDDIELTRAIVRYLNALCARECCKDNAEEIEVASQCLQGAMGFDEEDEGAGARDAFGLMDIFKAGKAALLRPKAGGDTKTSAQADERKTSATLLDDPRFKKFVDKISEKGFFQGHTQGSEKYEERISQAHKKFMGHFQKAADKLKADGNVLMKAKNYEAALECYAKAIEKCPNGANSHQYFGNSAAARMNLKDYAGAEEDCRKGLALAPEYAKLHKRLGTALLMQRKYKDAKSSFERAARADPTNAQSYQSFIQRADKGIAATSTTMSGSNTSTPPAVPNLSGLGGGGGGGLPNIMQMMQNPEMMKMATNMMKDPAFMGMAQNMMKNMGGAQGMADMMRGMGTGADTGSIGDGGDEASE